MAEKFERYVFEGIGVSIFPVFDVGVPMPRRRPELGARVVVSGEDESKESGIGGETSAASQGFLRLSD
jgi:hypothetical protein